MEKSPTRHVLFSILAMLAVASCTDQQDSFEYAKSHVWGDKFHGCDYQKIRFHDEYLDYDNSANFIERIDQLNAGITFAPKERVPEEIETSDSTEFIFKNVNSGEKMKFKRNGKDLYLAGIFIGGIWKTYGRNNSTYPTDFIICD